MLKISQKLSVTLSLVISILFMAVCIAGLFVLPELTRMLIDLPDNIGSRNEITDAGRAVVLALAYGIVAVLMLTDGFLFSLLLQVRRGLVFTPGVVSRTRYISWCCFLLGLLFCTLGIWFQLAFLVAFLLAFLGLCLRVVKNVLAEATRLKSENDLTV